MLCYAQVGVNTTTPSSTLDVVAKDPTGTASFVDGLLVPRVDRQRAQSMTSIPTSTMIYINDISTGTQTGTAVNVDAVGLYSYDGTAWTKLGGSGSSSTSGWNLTGNSGTTPGTNFIGTLDNQNVIFKRNNVQAGLLTASNTAFGTSSIPTTATGTGNTSLGTNSLSTLTTGARNIGVGLNTGRGITTGSSNIAIGGNTLSSTTAAAIQRNIAIGDNALISNNGGNSNIAIGVNTGTAITTGANNTLIGDTSGGVSLSTGTNNTVIGSIAGAGLTTGSNNVVLGASAGSNITTGGTNIAIGNNTQVPSATTSNQMNIGNAIFGTGMTGTLAAPAGNIGIGTSAPDASAILDISSTNSGILIPRVSSTTGIPNPATGLLVFNTSTSQFNVNIGTTSIPIWSALAAASTTINTQMARLANTPQNVTIGSAINLQALAFDNTGGFVTYNSGNSTFTLKAGKIYKLQFSANWVADITTPYGSFVRFQWYNVTTASYFGNVQHFEFPLSTNVAGGGDAIAFISAAVDTQVQARLFSGAAGHTFTVGDSNNGGAFPSVSIALLN